MLDENHYRNGIYSDDPLTRPICNGDGDCSKPSELDLAFSGAHLNFTIAMPPEALREAQSKARNLPRVNDSDIFDQLFLRKGPYKRHKLGVNFVEGTWLNFYFEDYLRTKRATKGATRLDESTDMANLATVYGRTKERETILRSFEGGKMRTSINPYNNEEVALLWSDVEEATVPNATFPLVFVLGDDELNVHWGHIFWHTLFVLEHNRVADKLAASNPSFDDARLYRMARVIMTHRQARIFMENFSSEVVMETFGVQVRFPAAIEFCRDDEYADLHDQGVELPMELLHAYVFHDQIPDDIQYLPSSKSLAYDIFRHPEGFLTAATRQEHLDAFSRTPISQPGAQNVPGFLKFVTIKQIQHTRQNGLPGYVDYVRYYGGPDIKFFDQLPHPKDIVEILKGIYPTVQDIEFYVGLMTEVEEKYDQFSKGFFLRASIILKYVARNFVTTSCYKDPYLYTEEFLTAEGIDLIMGPKDALVDLLETHFQLQDKTPFFGDGVAEEFHYESPKSMTNFKAQNLADFVGMNELWFIVASERFPEFQYLYVAILVAAMIYVLLLVSCGPIIRKYLSRLALTEEKGTADDELAQKQQLKSGNAQSIDVLATHYFIMFAVLLVQLPIYTVIMIFVFFSERQDYVFETFWFVGWLMPSIHLVLYIADIAVRSRVQWFLALHHIFWLLFFVISPIYRDLFTMKVGLTLDYFICYESGLYWLLFWSKLKKRQFSIWARKCGKIAVAVYGVSRLVQLPILASLFVQGYLPMAEFGSLGLYVFALLLTIGVQLSQLHVLLVFLAWKPLFGSLEKGEIDKAGHNLLGFRPSQSNVLATLADEWKAHSSRRMSLILEEDEQENQHGLSKEAPSSTQAQSLHTTGGEQAALESSESGTEPNGMHQVP